MCLKIYRSPFYRDEQPVTQDGHWKQKQNNKIVSGKVNPLGYNHILYHANKSQINDIGVWALLQILESRQTDKFYVYTLHFPLVVTIGSQFDEDRQPCESALIYISPTFNLNLLNFSSSFLQSSRTKSKAFRVLGGYCKMLLLLDHLLLHSQSIHFDKNHWSIFERNSFHDASRSHSNK